MKIISIKILLTLLIIVSFLSTDAFAETNVSTIIIYTNPSWKSFDAKVNGWTSINFDDSYWSDAKDYGSYCYGDRKARSISYPEEPSSQPYYFRKTFELSGTEIMSGKLYYCGGPESNIYVNDNYVGGGISQELDIAPYLKIGKNVIAVESNNIALIARIRVVSPALPTLPSPTPPTSTVSDTSSAPSGQPSKSASVSLTGEKTDVVLGEDILLKLSAVNLITKPKMHVQVIIIPPSGMSVTSSEFSKSGTNQFTANYELDPGDGKDIGVSIKPNQIGDFNVNGRIIYYFGDEIDKAEDQTLNLPIKVRKEIASTPAQSPIANPAQKSTPGFAGELAIIVTLFMALFIRKR